MWIHLYPPVRAKVLTLNVVVLPSSLFKNTSLPRLIQWLLCVIGLASVGSSEAGLRAEGGGSLNVLNLSAPLKSAIESGKQGWSVYQKWNQRGHRAEGGRHTKGGRKTR